MKKCLWCGKQDEQVKTQSLNLERFGAYRFYVHEEHEDNLRNWLFFQHSNYMKVQIVLAFLSVILLFMPLTGAMIVLELISLILMLKPTPPIKLCEHSGIVKAKSMVQAAGVALLLITSFSLWSLNWLGFMRF